LRAELYRSTPAEGRAGDAGETGEASPQNGTETVVAVATWTDGGSSVEVLDPSIPGLDAIVRPTPVVVDDASLRQPGTSGEVLLQPGDLQWFLAAVRTRAAALGLSVRFLAQGGPGGWDPASQYRRFDQQVEKLARERTT
jgi:hypothetical protein